MGSDIPRYVMSVAVGSKGMTYCYGIHDSAGVRSSFIDALEGTAWKPIALDPAMGSQLCKLVVGADNNIFVQATLFPFDTTTLWSLEKNSWKTLSGLSSPRTVFADTLHAGIRLLESNASLGAWKPETSTISSRRAEATSVPPSIRAPRTIDGRKAAKTGRPLERILLK